MPCMQAVLFLIRDSWLREWCGCCRCLYAPTASTSPCYAQKTHVGHTRMLEGLSSLIKFFWNTSEEFLSPPYSHKGYKPLLSHLVQENRWQTNEIKLISGVSSKKNMFLPIEVWFFLTAQIQPSRDFQKTIWTKKAVLVVVLRCSKSMPNKPTELHLKTISLLKRGNWVGAQDSSRPRPRPFQPSSVLVGLPVSRRAAHCEEASGASPSTAQPS